jgi:hypothetical protein
VLSPLDREMLRDVIEQPAKVARLRLDDGLAAALVADTGSGEALPLLAFSLRQLADGLPAGGTLTRAHYDDLGGVRGALTRHADAVLADAARASGLGERDVLAGLTRLVTVDETDRRARRRIKPSSLTEPLRVALGVFVERRLLPPGHRHHRHHHRPAHRPGRRASGCSTGRSEHYLWEDERLTATLTTLGMAGDGGFIVDLNDRAQAFLDATTRHVHPAQERERRRRTRTITVLSILLVLALIAAGIAIWQQQSARSAQHTAIARGMVAQADRIRDQDPDSPCNSASPPDNSTPARKPK